LLRELDPKVEMLEHLGAFAVFCDKTGNRAVITGDGRLLGAGGKDLWKEFMGGETAYTLALLVENMLHSRDKSSIQKAEV
jgi:hypothetical protein